MHSEFQTRIKKKNVNISLVSFIEITYLINIFLVYCVKQNILLKLILSMSSLLEWLLQFLKLHRWPTITGSYISFFFFHYISL